MISQRQVSYQRGSPLDSPSSGKATSSCSRIPSGKQKHLLRWGEMKDPFCDSCRSSWHNASIVIFGIDQDEFFAENREQLRRRTRKTVVMGYSEGQFMHSFAL